jgi:uncharacterized protein (DUF342 family)
MTDKVATFLLKVSTTDDAKEVFLHAEARMVAETVATPIDSAFVSNLIDSNGYEKYQKDEDAIHEVVKTLLESLKTVNNDEEAESTKLDTEVIARAIDAEITVNISSDKMKASVVIIPAKGGKDANLEDIKAVMEEGGVTYGINETAIKGLIEESVAPKIDRVEAEVAFGKEPVSGDDAQFVPLVPTAMERILKPQLREDGTVDMRDLGDMPTVTEGTHLMRKEPPTDGEKGVNVCWELIAPPKGIDKKFKVGAGTEISTEDENLLIASISGQPNLAENGMRVDDAVQVKAVDLSTGNLVLDANLLVKGDIGEGMKVRCEGDITVGGVIESADVKAKGNILVGKGIIGRPHFDSTDKDYSCSVSTDGELFAMYASHSELDVEGDIHIAEQILHCDTRSKGKIVVGNEKTVGSQIVGGYTLSAEGIETDILGASAGVATKLDLSGRLVSKNMELACTNSIIAGMEKRHSDTMDALSKFMNMPATPARQEYIVKFKNTIEHTANEVKKAEDLHDQIIKEIDKLSHGVQVRIKRKIHLNVSLTIGHHLFKTKREREAGRLFYDDGDIVYVSANVENEAES